MGFYLAALNLIPRLKSLTMLRKGSAASILLFQAVGWGCMRTWLGLLRARMNWRSKLLNHEMSLDLSSLQGNLTTQAGPSRGIELYLCWFLRADGRHNNYAGSCKNLEGNELPIGNLCSTLAWLKHPKSHLYSDTKKTQVRLSGLFAKNMSSSPA